MKENKIQQGIKTTMHLWGARIMFGVCCYRTCKHSWVSA